jgi:hypothetical protein
MKSIRPILILVISAFLLSTGCKKKFNISDKQEMLFQFERINYTSGYQHSGFIIDNNGNILTYNNPENWNFPDKNYSISANKVIENISKCKSSGKMISHDELQKYSNYIRNIASSKVTAIKNARAETGSTEFVCYQFLENSLTYKGSLIKMEGDFTCENLNFYTKKVVAWMKDINSSLPVN